MMITMRLPEELRDPVTQSATRMMRLYDDKNNVAYVVVPETIFERLSLADNDHPEIQVQYAHVAKSLGEDVLETYDDDTVV